MGFDSTEVAPYPTSEASFHALAGTLPDRAALWATAVEQSGGQVAVCITNRPESWSLLIGLGLSLLERFFFNPQREEERLYESARHYNLAAIYDAHHGTDALTLVQLVFSPRSAGQINHPECKWRSVEPAQEQESDGAQP